MKLNNWIALGLAVAVVTPVLTGWKADEAPKDKFMKADDLRTVFKDLKLKVTEDKDKNGKTLFILDDGTRKMLLFQYGSSKNDEASSLAIDSMYDAKTDLSVTNEWNANKRYTKGFVLNGETTILESDIDLSANPSQEAVKRWLNIFMSSAEDFEAAISKKD